MCNSLVFKTNSATIISAFRVSVFDSIRLITVPVSRSISTSGFLGLRETSVRVRRFRRRWDNFNYHERLLFGSNCSLLLIRKCIICFQCLPAALYFTILVDISLLSQPVFGAFGSKQSVTRASPYEETSSV